MRSSRRSKLMMIVGMLVVMGLAGLAGLVAGGLSSCSPLCIRNSDCPSGDSCLAGGVCGIGDAGLTVDFSALPDLSVPWDAATTDAATTDAAVDATVVDGSSGG